MSAELMESQFVRRVSSVRRPLARPSIRVTIISELTAWFSIKCFLWLPLGHTLGRFWFFFFFFIFYFLRIFFVFVNMGPYGSENFKTLLLLQLVAESFQTSPEFSSQWFSQNYIWDFWNFEFAILMIFFSKISNSPLYPMEKPKTSIIWKASDRRAKRSEIWDSRVLVVHNTTYMVYLWPCYVQSHFGVIWCICNFSSWVLIYIFI